MSHVFEDRALGLKLKGYVIVPNDALETTIAVHTIDITKSILAEHPEVVDAWLEKLHREYVDGKKSCDFGGDPVACFNLSLYEEFEKHYNSWNDGGLVAISLPGNRTIRLSKRPLFSISHTYAETCDVCKLSFGLAKEMVKHYKERHPAMIEKVTIPI